MLYTHFVNTLTRSRPCGRCCRSPTSNWPTLQQADRGDAEERRADARLYSSSRAPKRVLDAMLPYYVHYQVYQMVLDARASEHSARMVAMKNATDNAKQLIKDLTLEYNKIRQASITTELSKSPPRRWRSANAFNHNASYEQHGKIVQVIGPVVDVEFTARPNCRTSTTRSRSNTTSTATRPSSRSKCSSTSAKAGCAPSPCPPPKA